MLHTDVVMGLSWMLSNWLHCFDYSCSRLGVWAPMNSSESDSRRGDDENFLFFRVIPHAMTTLNMPMKTNRNLC